MADILMDQGQSLFFNHDYSDTSKLTEDITTNILRRILSSAEIDEAQIYGSSGSSNRALVLRSANNILYSIPLDLTGASIQTAIDNLTRGGIVFVPAGTYVVSSGIKFDSYMTIQGSGVGVTKLEAAGSGLGDSILAPRMPTDKYGNAKYAHVMIYDLSIDNKYSGTSGGIGINFHKVSVGEIRNVSISNVALAIRIFGLCYYNTITHIEIQNAFTGVSFTYDAGPPDASGPNENRIFGADLTDVDVGFDVEADNCTFYACTIRQGSIRPFTRGFRFVNSTQCTANAVYGAYSTNNTPLPGNDIGIEIGVNAERNVIVAPRFGSVTTPIADSSSLKATVVLGSIYQNYSSGTINPRLMLGNMQIYSSSATLRFRNLDDSNNAPLETGAMTSRTDNITMLGLGKGIVATSPDGSKTKRIFVNNSGTLAVEAP